MSHIADLADHVKPMPSSLISTSSVPPGIWTYICGSASPRRYAALSRRAGAASGRQRISNASLIDLDLDIRPVKRTFKICVLTFSGKYSDVSECSPIRHTISFEISFIQITQCGFPIERQVVTYGIFQNTIVWFTISRRSPVTGISSLQNVGCPIRNFHTGRILVEIKDCLLASQRFPGDRRFSAHIRVRRYFAKIPMPLPLFSASLPSAL